MEKRFGLVFTIFMFMIFVVFALEYSGITGNVVVEVKGEIGNVSFNFDDESDYFYDSNVVLINNSLHNFHIASLPYKNY